MILATGGSTVKPFTGHMSSGLKFIYIYICYIHGQDLKAGRNNNYISITVMSKLSPLPINSAKYTSV